jgi:hypothetical protein
MHTLPWTGEKGESQPHVLRYRGNRAPTPEICARLRNGSFDSQNPEGKQANQSSPRLARYGATPTRAEKLKLNRRKGLKSGTPA